MKNINTQVLAEQLLELGCEICCNRVGYTIYYGQGGYIVDSIEEYESDKELNNLSLIEFSTISGCSITSQGNVKYVLNILKGGN